MQHSLHRIWVVANTVTGDVHYASCQYTLAKNMYDLYRRHGVPLPLSLLRYDLSRSYFEELNRVIESDLQSAISALFSDNNNTTTSRKEK